MSYLYLKLSYVQLRVGIALLGAERAEKGHFGMGTPMWPRVNPEVHLHKNRTQDFRLAVPFEVGLRLHLLLSVSTHRSSTSY